MIIYDNIIIGAGASGLMCGAHAQGRTLVMDSNANAGAKLLISGGGKCNFSNTSVSDKNYFSQNPHFVKSALAGFTMSDITSLLAANKIYFEEKDHGKLFAKNAKNILDLLVGECMKNKTEFAFNRKVFSADKENEYFKIKTSGGEYKCKNLIVASGGMSYPKLGASSIGFETARGFGLNIIPLRPALCALEYPNEKDKILSELAGISCKAEVSAEKAVFTDDILFTHKGLSGPAILQISVYTPKKAEIRVNFMPGVDLKAVLNENKKGGKTFYQVLSNLLPPRMVKNFLAEYAELKIADANKKTMQHITDTFQSRIFKMENSGMAFAEVTAGGVDTKEINSSTMECRKVKGLYFIGEVLDVTGQLGGYNLHWAFASGYLCGKKV
ncbi:hypothetical protein Dip518_001547 [Parelusimicrobium proximum]|uniref:NAD(P)/FAD-dependent oxidoreductase n=1 Tax=Parelusimicrobium proximum TaxID=3228953 RepID=UPI003D164DE5